MDARKSNSRDNSAGSLVDVLGGAISQERARELLEASGWSIERAVELHFNTTTTPPTSETNKSAMCSDEVVVVDSDKVEVSEEKSKGSVKSIENESGQSVSTPSKRRRLQSTLEAFVKTPKRSPNQKTVQPSINIDSGSNEPTKKLHPAAATPKSVVGQEQNDHVLQDQKPSIQAASKAADGHSTLLPSIPYSSIIQQLTVVSNTTKRTIKLEALQALFRQALSILGGVEQNETEKSTPIPLTEHKARLLHMILDLILGKITLLTIAQPKANRSADGSVVTNLSSSDGSVVTNLTLKVSGSAVSKALQVVLGISKAQMREAYRRMGDMGDVAADAARSKTSVRSFFIASSTSSPKKKKMSLTTVDSVHENLQSLATVPTGKGSMTIRHNILVKLFRSTQNDEATLRFLVRTVLGNMRIGATIKTVLAALAMSVDDLRQRNAAPHPATKGLVESNNPKQTVSDRLQKVFNVCPRLNEICLALLQGGIERAEQDCTLSLGYPVEPMLANPAHSLEQVEEFLRKSKGSAAVAEWKYDGVRCQAHCRNGSVKLFSRHLLDQTDQYPDAASCFIEASSKKGCTSFICDAEIVAVAPSTTGNGTASSSFRFLPFQDLRRGASNAAKSDGSGQVAVFCFDLLYINGKSLLKLPYSTRQRLLRENFAETSCFAFAQSTPLPSLTESAPFDQKLLTDALTEAVNAGAEGLMVKLTGAYDSDKTEPHPKPALGFYESGTRSHEWLKVKRDYVGGAFAETIDVVPIGAWYGNGRKAKAGYLSPVLLAVYDDDDGVFRSISRCMSFSDSMYEAMKKFYFEGIPYPDNADAPAKGNKTSSFQSAVSATAKENKEDDSGSDAMGGDEEGPNKISDIEMDDEEALVHCFTGRPPSTVIMTNESPPIWFKPTEVFEVSFADLSLSRTHRAAEGLIDDQEGRGVALRFPRFKRRRPDKSPEQATTSTAIAQLYYQQSKTAVK